MTKAAAVIIIELRMCMLFFCTEAVMMRECPLPGKLVDRFGAEIGQREEGSAVPRTIRGCSFPLTDHEVTALRAT